MIKDLNKGTIKVKFSNILSWSNFYWVIGILCFSVPYNISWSLGNGNFGYDIRNTIILSIVGIFLFTFSSKKYSAVGCNSPSIIDRLIIGLQLTLLMSLIGLAYFGLNVTVYMFVLGSVAFLQWAKLILVRHNAISEKGNKFFHTILNQSWVTNGVFWICLLAALIYRDLYVLISIDTDNSYELVGSLLNRVATQILFVLGILFTFKLVNSLTPKVFRVLTYLIFSLIPILVILDFLIKQYWNQSLITVVNLLTSSGSIDLEKEIVASGVNLTLNQITLIAFFTVLIALLAFSFMNYISGLLKFRISNRFILFTSLACWIFVVCESGLSHLYKRTEQWQRHYKLYDAHFGIFAPPAGFEKMDIVFRDLSPDNSDANLLEELEDSPELTKPDIYVFMIESWRSDSITPEVAPFLSKFRKEECQNLGRTYAGSNCTPLSWFSMFHSQLAIHWSDAIKQLDGQPDYKGAYPVRALKKLGYEVQVRAVCDLMYRNLGPLNFGDSHILADYLTHYTEHKGEPMHISEREKLVMSNQREYLNQNPQAPQFHFTALDSPHYNYFWPADFDQLHADCANDIPVKLNPSKEIVGEVVRRYQNAVHWVDYAIEEFVDFLKFKGKYDNSVIIITGDHGEEFQEEGSWFHCSSLNRYQTEVPIIIKWPKWVKNLPSHTNVSHYDIMPSVMDLIGVDSKFYSGLAGQSLFLYNDSPREAVLSTVHRGESGIGFCLVGGKTKVKFSFPGPWSTEAPDQLVVTEYSDVLDRPLDFRDDIGDLTHADYIRKKFPWSSERFFERFEKH